MTEEVLSPYQTTVDWESLSYINVKTMIRMNFTQQFLFSSQNWYSLGQSKNSISITVWYALPVIPDWPAVEFLPVPGFLRYIVICSFPYPFHYFRFRLKTVVKIPVSHRCFHEISLDQLWLILGTLHWWILRTGNTGNSTNLRRNISWKERPLGYDTWPRRISKALGAGWRPCQCTWKSWFEAGIVWKIATRWRWR